MGKKASVRIILIGLAIVILLGLGGYFAWSKKEKAEPLVAKTPEVSISDWKVYTNTELGYSVQYPPNWHVNVPSAGSSVDEIKEVIFSEKLDPQFGSETEEDVGPYVSISIDPRSLEQMREVMKNIAHDDETIGSFKGLTAYVYRQNTPTYSSYHLNIPYKGKIYSLSTSKFYDPEVKKMIESFQFTE